MARPYIIGVTGGSGSGKTTFIKKLRAIFSENELCLLSQDNYYKPIQEQQKDAEGIENFDVPRSIDKKAFVRDIDRLARGEAVELLEYTFNNADAEPKKLIFRPAPILVVEGLFVFHTKKIAERLDLKIFVDAKDALKIKRRILRDAVERGYDLADVLYRVENHVNPSFEKFIEPYRDDADLVVNNNDDFDAAFEVVVGFLRNKLGR